jgi:hypothetical protein
MTVKWSSYAQSITTKPMKGMLTGPVTILNWSFPRADVSRELQSKQLALALRDEVIDLEKAGIHAIQVDEPAIREGVSLINITSNSDSNFDSLPISYPSAGQIGTSTSSGRLTRSSSPPPASPIHSKPTHTSVTPTSTIFSPPSSVLMLTSSLSKLPRAT